MEPDSSHSKPTPLTPPTLTTSERKKRPGVMAMDQQQEPYGNRNERDGGVPRSRLDEHVGDSNPDWGSQEVDDASNDLESEPDEEMRLAGRNAQGRDSASSMIRSSSSFPAKLHEVLQRADREGFQSIISWCDVGIFRNRNIIEDWKVSGCTPFKVHDPDKFVEKIVPRFFPAMGKFKSFLRQLNLWGFSRMRSKDILNGCYYHPVFARDRPDLCPNIKRTKTKGLYVRGGTQGGTRGQSGNAEKADIFSEFTDLAFMEGEERYRPALRATPEDADFSNETASGGMRQRVLPAIHMAHMPSYALGGTMSSFAQPIGTGAPMATSFPLPAQSLSLLAETRTTTSAGAISPFSSSRQSLPVLVADRVTNGNLPHFALTAQAAAPPLLAPMGSPTNLGSVSEKDLRYVMLGIQIAQQSGDDLGPDRNGLLNHLLRINLGDNVHSQRPQGDEQDARDSHGNSNYS